MITKMLSDYGKVRVTFSMPAAIWADTIYLVGDFNGWSSHATPLRLSDECWSVSLELEADQEYQYRYLVNGSEWYNDWQADRYEPNEHGGDNSVVVTLSLEEPIFAPIAAEIADAMTLTFPFDQPLYMSDEFGDVGGTVVTIPPNGSYAIEVCGLSNPRRMGIGE